MLPAARSAPAWLSAAWCAAALPAQLPCVETSLGTNLNLGNDAVATALPLGFAFPGPGGAVHTTISVSSNGFVWLGSGTAHGCCNGSETGFLSAGPRIAPLWTDLDPGASAGAGVYFQSLPAVGPLPARAVVTWDAVPEAGAAGTATVQVQLLADGTVTMHWSETTRIAGHATLVGVTEGQGATANPLDLSAILGNAVVNTQVNPTAHQTLGAGQFDLAGRSLRWLPNSSGGYRISERTQCRTASFAVFGRGCPAVPTVYELFPAGTLDLSNTSIRFAPNGNGGWLVSAGTTAPDVQVAANVVLTGDDVLATNLVLPFTWSFAGSSTGAIDVSSNGCVYLHPGTIPDPRCCAGSVPRFLAEPASIAVLWLDLHPPGGGGVFFDLDPGSQRAYVTWRDCPEFGNSAVRYDAQLVLEAAGAFELRYATVGNVAHDCLIGFTLGGGAPDPGSLDLSMSLPLDTGIGGTPLSIAAAAGSSPAVGTVFQMRIGGVPAATALGFRVLGLTQLIAPLELSGLGMPGCYQHVTVDAVDAVQLPGDPTLLLLPIPNDAALVGLSVFAQMTAPSAGTNPAGFVTSNGGFLGIGR